MLLKQIFDKSIYLTEQGEFCICPYSCAPNQAYATKSASNKTPQFDLVRAQVQTNLPLLKKTQNQKPQRT